MMQTTHDTYSFQVKSFNKIYRRKENESCTPHERRVKHIEKIKLNSDDDLTKHPNHLLNNELIDQS